MKARRAHRGVTLIEMMTVITLLAVLMVFAVPSFVAFERNAELNAAVNALVAAIQNARGEAMKRGRQALVVPADGSHWSSGWLVFVDGDPQGHRAYDEGVDSLILRAPALPRYFSAGGNGAAAGTSPYILFNPSGFPMTQSGAFAALTFWIGRNDLQGPSLDEQTRLIIVSKAGRVRTCKPDPDTCRKPDSN